MSLPRLIYMRSDGLTTSTQIALKPVPNIQELWDNFLIPFLNKKATSNSQFLHEEIADFHPCKSVRKIRFLYDNSPGSFQMFEQLLRFENPELTTIYQLVPVLDTGADFSIPRLVDTSTGQEVTILDLQYDESEKPYAPYVSFKYVYITQSNDHVANQVFLKPVDEQGQDVLYQLFQRMDDYFDRAQADRTLTSKEKHELVDHVDCGRVLRFFFHYDKSQASHDFLYSLLSTRTGPVKCTLRITLVPRTPDTENILRKTVSDVHYPCLVNAASRSEQTLQLYAIETESGTLLPDAVRAFIHSIP